MDWFLYYNGLRHEWVKFWTDILNIFNRYFNISKNISLWMDESSVTIKIP